MKGEITYKEFLMLEGLREMARQEVKRFYYIQSSIGELLGADKDEIECGHIGDSMFEDYSAEELLKRLKINVENREVSKED